MIEVIVGYLKKKKKKTRMDARIFFVGVAQMFFSTKRYQC